MEKLSGKFIMGKFLVDITDGVITSVNPLSHLSENNIADFKIAVSADRKANLDLSNVVVENVWKFEAFDKTGHLKWTDTVLNLVTTEGLNDLLTQYFKGSSYTAAFFIGLTAGTPSFAAGDTMSSHAGWTEVVAYDESVRQTLTLGTASAGSISNTASKGVFTISANSTTIGGAFLATNSTKGGTTGTLYGGAAFAAGNKVLDDDDVLNVTITLTATSA